GPLLHELEHENVPTALATTATGALDEHVEQLDHPRVAGEQPSEVGLAVPVLQAAAHLDRDRAHPPARRGEPVPGVGLPEAALAEQAGDEVRRPGVVVKQGAGPEA